MIRLPYRTISRSAHVTSARTAARQRCASSADEPVALEVEPGVGGERDASHGQEYAGLLACTQPRKRARSVPPRSAARPAMRRRRARSISDSTARRPASNPAGLGWPATSAPTRCACAAASEAVSMPATGGNKQETGAPDSTCCLFPARLLSPACCLRLVGPHRRRDRVELAVDLRLLGKVIVALQHGAGQRRATGQLAQQRQRLAGNLVRVRVVPQLAARHATSHVRVGDPVERACARARRVGRRPGCARRREGSRRR